MTFRSFGSFVALLSLASLAAAQAPGYPSAPGSLPPPTVPGPPMMGYYVPQGLPPAALYKRWVAFGLLSSHSHLHGSGSYRVPWQYDDDACDTASLRLLERARRRGESAGPSLPSMRTGLLSRHICFS